MTLSRRNIIASAALLPAFAVSGCGNGSSPFSLISAAPASPLKLAVDRAMPTLKSTGGFIDTSVARVSLPSQMAGQAGGSIVGSQIGTTAFREVLTRLVNGASQKGAEAAGPIIDTAVSGIADSPTASRTSDSPSTDALRLAIGSALIAPTRAAIEARLIELDPAMVSDALGQVVGIDHAMFVDDITNKAIAGMFASIAREEMAVRGIPAPA